ncbi:MAG: HAD-IIA family hydrolase [Candidatus Nanopelagicales bacterium]|nr:HAD-IIA family hydrolase [Candidatus Nanopelagicales bacterium]MDZ4250505.1 HAD-IIA family hydrolase [Candidatus Nanopelagicales bacterium]
MPAATTLIQSHDAVLVDLDGVVYVGGHEVPHASASLHAVGTSGVHLCFVTNNASRTPRKVAEQLNGFGLDISADEVVTSAQAGAELVASMLPPGAAVLAVGGPGVAAALLERGLRPVDAQGSDSPLDAGSVSAVLQGFGRQLNWLALARGAQAVHTGVPWIATNDDMTVPTEYGIVPGNGTMVAAVAAATGRRPTVVGKPHAALLQEAVRRTGSRSPLVIGDRLDTDIEGAHHAGLPSLLVLTGVSRTLDLWRAPSDRRPDHVGTDLRALLRPALSVEMFSDSAECGGAVAAMQDGRLVVTWTGDPAAAVIAAAHLIWQQESELAGLAEEAERLDAAVALAINNPGH